MLCILVLLRIEALRRELRLHLNTDISTMHRSDPIWAELYVVVQDPFFAYAERWKRYNATVARVPSGVNAVFSFHSYTRDPTSTWVRAMERTMLVLAMAMAMASGARADSVVYVIQGPSGAADCRFLESGAYTVSAWVNLTEPAKSLQLSAPTRCGGPGITWRQPVSGDPNSVLTLNLGGCVSGLVGLFDAQFNVDGCCPALLQGPVVGGIERTPPVLIGCDDTPRYLVPPCSTGRPSLTAPADGASTSVTPFMSWDHSFGDYCVETVGVPIFTVQYGTDPENLDQTYSANDQPHLTLPTLAPHTQYFWRVRVGDFYGVYTGTMNNFSEIQSFTTEGPTDTRGRIIQVTRLYPNVPNPFNPATTIRLELANESRVRLQVFDTLGRLVTTLVNQSLPVGEHRFVWTGTNSFGRPISSGVYMYRFSGDGLQQTGRMTLLR